MPVIKSISCRRILNSHVNFTNEFIIEFEDGSIGTGASPQGETISIYEDKKVTIDSTSIIQKIKKDGYIGRSLEQEFLDKYLDANINNFGRNNVCGLSLAFYNALSKTHTAFELFGKPPTKLTAPSICCNILNGGWHAYTNPVLSDFHEYIMVSKRGNPEEIIAAHNEIQRVVKERLIHQTKTVVSGNTVNCFTTRDNRECIDFLLNVCESLGYLDQFDLMIDASGGDLFKDDSYCLSITDNLVRSKEEFYDYWLDIIHQYKLGFLEDPFHENDYENWHRLTTSQDSCYVIGDNFYSTDAERIREGAERKYTHGVIIKPNQAGSITAVKRALETAQSNQQIPITSHRSISTESTFISLLTCMYGVKYIKVGPLMTDYSSVIRYNEMIRISEDGISS
jgi:enolase